MQSASSTPAQRYGAMIRLAHKEDELAHTAAMDAAKDANAFLRGGAAQALGYFSDEDSMAALRDLLKDQDKSVRLFAIEGLGHRQGSLRSEELKALLETPEVDDEMKVEDLLQSF